MPCFSVKVSTVKIVLVSTSQVSEMTLKYVAFRN